MLPSPSGLTPDSQPLARRDGVMTFGVMVPHFGAQASRRRILDGSVLVESLGFDAVWVRDHLLWTPHEHESADITFAEPLMTLASIAAVTTRIQLATAVLIPLRWPLKLAQDLAALSYLSDGRVVAGLGAGHWHEELAAVGLDPDAGQEILAETVEIVRRIWSEKVVTHAGPRFAFDSVSIEPKPLRPIPLWYGGTTRAAVRRAIRAYDGWIPGGLPFQTLDDRLSYLAELSAADKRSTPVVGYMPRFGIAKQRKDVLADLDVKMLASGSEGVKHWIKPKSGAFETLEDFRGCIVIGEPAEVVDQILELGERKIDHFIFDLRHQFETYEVSLELIASAVLPEVRAALRQK
jgi:probable F420-dependent oxidoreductase